MKEPRFCGGVNTEPANLWTSKPAPLTVTVTLSPICISVHLNVCLFVCLPLQIPTSNFVQEKRRIKHNKCSNFLKPLNSSLSASLCPKYLYTILLSISFRPSAAFEFVWLKLPLGPGDLPACSLQ